jgi:two-component system sensor histidine kinase YesM
MKPIAQNIRRWYYNISINTKLKITNIVIILIPMIILAVLSNKISTDIIFEKSVKSSIQELNTVSRSLDGLFNQVEYLSKLTATNANIQKVIGVRQNQLPIFLEQRIDVIGSLEDIIGDKNVISAVSIMTTGKYIVTSSNIDPIKFSSMEGSLKGVLENGKLSKGDVLYESTEPIKYFSNAQKVDIIGVYRYLLSEDSGEIKGVLRIDIDQNIIANLLPASTDELGEAFVIDESGRVIVSQNEDKLYTSIHDKDYFKWIIDPKRSDTFKIGEQSLLVTSVKNERLGWYIIRFVPTKTLIEDSNRVTILICLVVLLCISLAVGASVVNSRLISRPIIRLANDMKHAGHGDMEVRFNSVGNDEIGYLGHSFNTMLEQITELMDKMYIEQKKKREFELMALQAQINPHFLYNTLESVCALAIKNRNVEVVRMVKSLALFYRAILSEGRNVISIQEEIENVKHYLVIQKIRYGDKFDYFIDIAPEINDKSVVKLVIQPLIENAIYHGIKQKQGKGIISIRGKENVDHILISVADDGIGFSDQKSCLEVLSTKPINQKQNYGLNNVNERIKLYFGAQYGLTISSRTGVGTRVDVTLPVETYER